MTQRKVVLTSTSALASRPNYVSNKKRNPTEQAQPALLLSEAKQATTFDEIDVVGVVNNPPQTLNKKPVRGFYERGSSAREAKALRNQLDHAVKQNRPQRIKELTNELQQLEFAINRKNLDTAAALDGLLSELTRGQRQQLLDRLALENQQGVQNRDLDMWSEGVRTALEATIGGSGGAAYGLMLCKRQLGLSSTWRPIEAFMRSSGLADLDVVERQAVYNLLAQLVVEAAGYTARKSGAPLSLKLTASHTNQVSGIFERAFPGYLAAGLASVVARQSLR